MRVLDLGAGTGICTRAIASLGHEVVAIDPDIGMLAQLRRANSTVPTLAGVAEAIPLRDASVDGVVAAQAYHWFNHRAAHAELGRVIRDGGVFGPIWNIRDESVPWVAELTRIAFLQDATGSGSYRGKPVDVGPRFGPSEIAEFRHSVTHTADTLVALLGSRSYYLTAQPDKQRKYAQAVRDLVSGLPPTFELPYLTIAQRARRE